MRRYIFLKNLILVEMGQKKYGKQNGNTVA
jgi:hypothetical protein